MRRVCPDCGKATIFKSKKDGEGFYCWKAKDGCGHTFGETDPRMSLALGQLNPDKVCDLHNTILKIGCKRSKVGGVLTCTAASEIFTQDLEDMDVDDMDVKAGTAPRAVGATKSNGTPAPAAAAATGSKRVSPIQVRELNLALMNLEVGVKEVNDMDLRGRDRETAIAQARLHWVSKMMDQPFKAMSDLTADQAISLIAAAKAGEMPPVAAQNDKDDTGGIT
jgi:hypothetical protein